jgi:hypothetical protein
MQVFAVLLVSGLFIVLVAAIAQWLLVRIFVARKHKNGRTDRRMN